MKAYQIKVVMKGTKPPVWRRMIIPAGITFDVLAAMLNEAWQWCGYHMYSFEFSKLGLCFEEEPEDFGIGNMKTLEACDYVIDEYMESQKTFTYLYDFGDSWEHSVTVEEILEDYNESCAKVIKYKGNSFPEDCGGVYGYYQLEEILKNPEHPEFEQMKEWYEMQDPEEYDMDIVNEGLYDIGMGDAMGLQEAVDILVVVDMQKDFIDGALGTEEAKKIVPKVVEKIHAFDGLVLYTRDTHEGNYLETQEGLNLPVEHCIEGTDGWQLHPEIAKCVEREETIVDKPTFGSADLAVMLAQMDEDIPIASITLVGLCTDICVISNAMVIKAFLPEVPITVDASCCAGVTPESHMTALQAMKMCQIEIQE